MVVFAACGLEPVSEAGLGACGPGTRLENGACVAQLSCAAGTHQEGTQCFADTTTGLRCGLGTHQEGSSCVADSGLVCGTGTIEQGGSCVATLSCGAGTRQQDTQCVPSTGLTCGAGTVEQGGVCVASLTCGAGTVQQGTQCVPGAGLTCGAGTTQMGNACVAAGPISCGVGTMLQGSSCVPTTTTSTGWYEVRVGATQIPADGYSKIPVLALGRLPSGAPATDAVVLSVSRSSAGSILMPGLTLGELGSMTYFTPCSSGTNPMCAGPAKLEMRLNNNPTQVVAESQTFTLVAPMGVGTTAPCDPYPNALFFDGTGYIFTGTQLVTNGTFQSSAGAAPTVISVSIDPTLSSQGSWWTADFAAPSGAGPLGVQVYPTAERYPFQPPGIAGLDVTGDGRGCNQSSGRFQVHHMAFANNQLSEFIVTFEQFCEKSPSNVLRGCLKYTR